MVTRLTETLLGRGLLLSGLVRVSGGKYEIVSYDEDDVTRAHGRFEVDQENRLRWLDIQKAEQQLKRNGKRLKLVIANLPTGSPIEFDIIRKIHPRFALEVKSPGTTPGLSGTCRNRGQAMRRYADLQII